MAGRRPSHDLVRNPTDHSSAPWPRTSTRTARGGENRHRPASKGSRCRTGAAAVHRWAQVAQEPPAPVAKLTEYPPTAPVWVYRSGSWRPGVIVQASSLAAMVRYRPNQGVGTAVDTVTAGCRTHREDPDKYLDRSSPRTTDDTKPTNRATGDTATTAWPRARRPPAPSAGSATIRGACLGQPAPTRRRPGVHHRVWRRPAAAPVDPPCALDGYALIAGQ